MIIHDVVVVELFDVEYYRHLEMWVRDQSRSLKMVPFESLFVRLRFDTDGCRLWLYYGCPGCLRFSVVLTVKNCMHTLALKRDCGRNLWTQFGSTHGTTNKSQDEDDCYSYWHLSQVTISVASLPAEFRNVIILVTRAKVLKIKQYIIVKSEIAIFPNFYVKW